MSKNESPSPADIASKKAITEVFSHINQKKNFVFEAGAGAGKTYSLVEALRYLIQSKGTTLLKRGQKIACITYTNVAKDQILNRTDRHPVILSETIHSFNWSQLKKFQSKLRILLPEIGKWKSRLDEVGGIGHREVIYDLGYPKVEDEKVWLHHNDVISLMIKFMELPKFRQILTSLYPILFIDEYQDADKDFVQSLKKYFIEPDDGGPIIGFFGDHWQKIYGSKACGKIESKKLGLIEKAANFRSKRIIVQSLNKMRPKLTQEVKDPQSEGSIVVFHTNNWRGMRREENHWEGDMPSKDAHSTFEAVKDRLEREDWDFNSKQTKVLILTHNAIANKQGYNNLAKVFQHPGDYIKKEDDYIAFFSDILEPIATAFLEKKYGEMFQSLGRTLKIKCHKDKILWAQEMEHLCELRSKATIGNVIEHLLNVKRPRFPDKIEKQEIKYQQIKKLSEEEIEKKDKKLLEKLNKLKAVSYSEMTALARFIREETPFSTKHSVKGEEYDNVFAVFGRGWNQYNFESFLELEGSSTNIPRGKQDFYERNRNLFYVVCSRPISRLALLFTQKLSDEAMQTLSSWFGHSSIQQAPLRKTCNIP